MTVLIEVLSIIWHTVVAMLGTVINVVIELLPEFLQLKQIMGYFTPEGIIALCVGVPTIVIVAIKLMIKILQKNV